MNIRQHKHFLLAAISGTVTGIALITGWWPLLFLGCFGLLLTSFTETQSKKSLFWTGFSFGTSKLLAALSWGFSVYPINWLGDFHPALAISLIGFYWLLASVVIGTATGVTLYFLHSFQSNRILLLFLIPIFLTLSESFGALLYSFFFSGVGSYIQMYFSFGFVGYGLALSDLFLPLAAIGGVYSLSFYSYVVTTLLYESVLGTKKHRVLFGGAAFLFLLLPLSANLPPYEPTNKTAAIINTSYTSKLLLSETGQITKATTTINAVQTALSTSAEVIALPEDARFVHSFNNPNAALAWLRFQTSSSVKPVIYDSARAFPNGDTILRGYVFDTSTTTTYHFDKTYLVPQGEFVPYFAEIGLAFADSNWRKQVFNHLSYRPSSETHYPNSTDVAPYLFCFEAVNPIGIKNALKRHDASFIVHPVSHAWFTNQTPSLRTQLLAMLRVQAAWNNKPIIVAGNEFDGFILYPNGGISTGETVAETALWNIRLVEL